jgi:hypothetical protein
MGRGVIGIGGREEEEEVTEGKHARRKRSGEELRSRL